MERDELDAEVSDYRDSTRWIPVTEKLPELYHDALVNVNSYERNGIYSGYLTDDEDDYWIIKDPNNEDGIDIVNHKDVTHWMNYPEPPEVKA
jgi:hypothetical protein